MTTGAGAVDSVCRAVPDVAARVGGAAELGDELSRQVGRVVPHDGYLLTGFDPVTGARCFLSCANSYDSGARRRMDSEDALGRTRSPVAELVDGAFPVVVLGAGAWDERPETRRLHRLMAADSYGSEMCVALVHRGIARGALVLLRERGSRPFSPAEATRAADLAEPLARAVQVFMTARPLRPRHFRFPPVVVVIDADDRITGMTSTGADPLTRLLPGVYPTRRGRPADPAERFAFLWHLAYTARRTAAPALTRAPTSHGWFSLRAQPLTGGTAGAVVVTLQPAPAADLLPALALWYGISAREQTVVEQAMRGEAVKQIARRLHLSPHTVNDHLKAIYRKTGVASREELIACLSY
ncbi:helix-turn-helix transcriptional regulator [Streptomyces aureocirculatus]|uniref:helix-turn-helix transcriptional regulator n=1 Tax=Streptomyces aureocirculatus TaxID=67275 RepID=UPI001CEC7A22|nr:helix-turn-helix transcriptional regulator [Streptomyces aureocirculatus]